MARPAGKMVRLPEGGGDRVAGVGGEPDAGPGPQGLPVSGGCRTRSPEPGKRPGTGTRGGVSVGGRGLLTRLCLSRLLCITVLRKDHPEHGKSRQEPRGAATELAQEAGEEAAFCGAVSEKSSPEEQSSEEVSSEEEFFPDELLPELLPGMLRSPRAPSQERL